MLYLARNRCEYSNSFKLLLYSVVVFLQAFSVQRLRLTKGAAKEKRRCVFELMPQKANFSHFYHHLSAFHFTACVFCLVFFSCCCCFLFPRHWPNGRRQMHQRRLPPLSYFYLVVPTFTRRDITKTRRRARIYKTKVPVLRAASNAAEQT